MDIKYVSAEQYSKNTGLGVEEVKRLCRTDQLEHFMTEGGHYKIKVMQNGVPKEQYEKLLEEHIKLKTIVANASKLFAEIK